MVKKRNISSTQACKLVKQVASFKPVTREPRRIRIRKGSKLPPGMYHKKELVALTTTTGYNEAMFRNVCRLLVSGATISQIAYGLGLEKKALQCYMEKERFTNEVARNEKLANALVKRALWLRATGYEHESVKIFYDKERKKVIRVKYMEYFPPETRATETWLRLRSADDRAKLTNREERSGEVKNYVINQSAEQNKLQPDEVNADIRKRVERNLQSLQRYRAVDAEFSPEEDK